MGLPQRHRDTEWEASCRGDPPPLFVSVASKGFSVFVSVVFATLAGRLISVADKGLREGCGRTQGALDVGKGIEETRRGCNELTLLGKGSVVRRAKEAWVDRKSTRLNSSHMSISYAVFCLKKK